MKRVPLLLLLCCPLIRLTAATVTDLRCEYLRNPLGIDSTRPRLSWAIQSDVRGEQQTAYQVLVASSEQVLKADRWDLWDSGKVLSDRSIQLDYAGRELTSHQQCFWKVRIWDKDQKPSSWSDPVFWSMGLLQVDDWKAKWIGLSVEEKTNYLTGTDWIWFPEGDPTKSAPLGNRYFRRQFVIPPEREIKRARFLITGDSECKAFFNGRDIGGRNNYRYVKDNDVTFRLEPGTNFIAVLGKNYGTEPKPAGLIALLEIQFTSGDPIVIKTDGSWKASDQEIKGWNEAGFNDSNWVAAKDLGPAGMEPWNNVRAPEDRRLAARWLRKEFEIKKPVKRAIAYYSGLGLSELYVNGEKAGDHVLSPGLTEYPKRVYYVTFDVTKQVRPGVNALGVVLGNGRFYSPRSRIYAGMPSCGFPKLLLHLRIEHTDGSISEVVSDETWKITADGPITANNEYDGEEYDARKELADWASPGCSDSSWQPAQVVPAPSGKVVAQMIEPIRVIQTLKPVAVTEPKSGVFIFDLGQNMVGWCRLHVSGAAGSEVSLRFAETLQPDGTLYLANIRGARVTDIYTLKGKGRETWEPRFTYHGFRYVEVTGYPGKPPLSTLEGRVVHDDLECLTWAAEDTGLAASSPWERRRLPGEIVRFGDV